MDIPQDMLETFKESYDKARGCFYDVNGSEAEQARFRKEMAATAKENYEIFARLADERKDDGNNVPLVMAAIESMNQAKFLYMLAVESIADQKDPDLIVGLMQAEIYKRSTGILHQLYWEKYQSEQLEKSLSDV